MLLLYSYFMMIQRKVVTHRHTLEACICIAFLMNAISFSILLSWKAKKKKKKSKSDHFISLYRLFGQTTSIDVCSVKVRLAVSRLTALKYASVRFYCVTLLYVATSIYLGWQGKNGDWAHLYFRSNRFFYSSAHDLERAHTLCL